jgi:hypothetical protein
MPRYYFSLKNKRPFEDVDGLELADVNAARTEAFGFARPDAYAAGAPGLVGMGRLRDRRGTATGAQRSIFGGGLALSFCCPRGLSDSTPVVGKLTGASFDRRSHYA